ARRLAPLAEHLHVGMPEAVDRLELVADEEPLAARAADQVDQLALQAVRVLELVDHHRAEAQLLALADRRVVAQEVACTQLQVLEVERRLAVLRLLVRGSECRQKLLQEVAVGGRELVERRLLDHPARLLVARGALPARAELAEIEQPLRRFALERELLAEAASRLVELLETLLQAAALAELEHQLAAGRAECLVDARQHATQPGGAVDGEQ